MAAHGPLRTFFGYYLQDWMNLYRRACLWYLLYGWEFIMLHVFGCQQTWCMIHYLIKEPKEKSFDVFRISQQSENAAVAVAGTITATIALASTILPPITKVSWIVPALWLFSLLSGLTAVMCSCNQQMTISRRLESKDLFSWMNDNSRADGQSTGFAVPDFYAVLNISLPRMFLHYSLQAYMLGLAIYLALLWRDDAGDEAPGDNQKIFITTMVALTVCWAVFFVSDISNRCKNSAWEENLKNVKSILKGSGKVRNAIGNQDWDPEMSKPALNSSS